MQARRSSFASAPSACSAWAAGALLGLSVLYGCNEDKRLEHKPSDPSAHEWYARPESTGWQPVRAFAPVLELRRDEAVEKLGGRSWRVIDVSTAKRLAGSIEPQGLGKLSLFLVRGLSCGDHPDRIRVFMRMSDIYVSHWGLGVPAAARKWPLVVWGESEPSRVFVDCDFAR